MAYVDADQLIDGLDEAIAMVKAQREQRAHMSGEIFPQLWEVMGALSYLAGRVSGKSPELESRLKQLVQLMQRA